MCPWRGQGHCADDGKYDDERLPSPRWVRQLAAEAMKGNQRALKALFNREGERILDEDARLAKQKKHYEEFSRELSEISEGIQKRKKKDEAARAGNQDAAKDEETRPEDEDKLYDPDA